MQYKYDVFWYICTNFNNFLDYFPKLSSLEENKQLVTIMDLGTDPGSVAKQGPFLKESLLKTDLDILFILLKG
ncbi:hypothetical protein COE25_28410 [Bacillus sp. AFS031507]|nr:hypothetical protein COE25_28410 [Bacillus sp. AFS031507]